MIVNSAIEFIRKGQDQYEILNTKKQSEFDKGIMEISTDLTNMRNCLKKSLPGIYNLKETYATCTQTCARIDVILNKIKNCVEDTSTSSEDSK